MSEDKAHEPVAAYQTFLQERRALLDTAKEAADRYAKAILTLSAGALALSMGFMKDLVPNPHTSSLRALSGSWISFACSLSAVVVSFLLAQSAFIKQVEAAETRLLKKDSKATGARNPYDRAIGWLNIISLVAFFVGIACAILFSIQNLDKLSHENRPTTALQSSNNR